MTTDHIQAAREHMETAWQYLPGTLERQAQFEQVAQFLIAHLEEKAPAQTTAARCTCTHYLTEWAEDPECPVHAQTQSATAEECQHQPKDGWMKPYCRYCNQPLRLTWVLA